MAFSLSVYSYNTEYDLALLINVLPVMPVFAERLMVLQTLYEKIKNDGYVLWYAQTEGSYKDKRLSGKYTCGDGIWTGITNYKKMFFRYHEVDEVDEMFALNGFDFVKKFHSPGNNVRLYKKNKYCLLKNNLTFEMISNEIPQDNSIKDPETVEPKIVSGSEKITEILPNPTKLSLANIYQSMLDKIPEGKDKDPKAPEIYHRVASLILSRVFRGSLSGMEIKRDKDNGLKVVDTVFKNKAKNGFFDDLANKFKILCPYIIVEAKNYSHDIKNQEFDQLSGRLDDKVGKFGIIVCRDAKNQEDIKSRCESYLNKGEYVII